MVVPTEVFQSLQEAWYRQILRSTNTFGMHLNKTAPSRSLGGNPSTYTSTQGNYVISRNKTNLSRSVCSFKRAPHAGYLLPPLHFLGELSCSRAVVQIQTEPATSLDVHCAHTQHRNDVKEHRSKGRRPPHAYPIRPENKQRADCRGNAAALSDFTGAQVERIKVKNST